MAEIELAQSFDDFLELAAARPRLGMNANGSDEAVAQEWFRSTTTNPAGLGAQMLIREQGAIVSCGSFAPKLFHAGNDRVVVAEFGGMYTAPEAQGRGMFRTVVNELERIAVERGVTAGYATANDVSGPIFVAKCGWVEAAPWIRWIRPAVPVLRHALDGVTSRARGWSFEVVDPAIVDDSLDEARRGAPHFVRSPEQFAWRYPAGRYRMIRASTAGRLGAWCVVGPTTRLGRRTAAIADLALGPDAGGVLPQLLRQAAQTVPYAQLVFGGTLAGGHAGAWKRSLAIGRPANMPLIAKGLTDPSDAKVFGGMSFDIGDSDTV